MSSTSERENLMGEQSTESVILPINLPYLLKRLSQVDFNLLVKSVDEEAVRRNGASTTEASNARLSAHSPDHGHDKKGSSSLALKQGQINAIQASFMAGVKISVIARQFGMQQSDVKKVISSYGQQRLDARRGF
jgi:hypothetical protein